MEVEGIGSCISPKCARPFDRAQLDLSVRRLLDDPKFRSVKSDFCRDMMACWLHDRLSRLLMADTGALAIVISISARHFAGTPEAASLAQMIDALAASGFASAKRIRATVDLLASRGVLALAPHPTDRRRLQIAPTDALVEVFRRWLRAALEAVQPVFDLTHPPADIAARPGLIEGYIVEVRRRKVEDGFTIFDGWPEIQVFADRRHGYVLLLQLACAEDGCADVNRARLAERCHVSPSHITALLVEGERAGWLTRTPGSSAVRLAPGFVQALDAWIAREIAVVGLWLRSLELAR